MSASLIWKKEAVVGKRKGVTVPVLPLPSFLPFYFCVRAL